MKINRLNLPIAPRKKTTHCTPAEILGRVDSLMKAYREGFEKLNAATLAKIEELLEEWKNS